MPERTDTGPPMESTPLAQRGADETAGGADTSPHDNEPHSRTEDQAETADKDRT